jgi:hypothetical protein
MEPGTTVAPAFNNTSFDRGRDCAKLSRSGE